MRLRDKLLHVWETGTVDFANGDGRFGKRVNVRIILRDVGILIFAGLLLAVAVNLFIAPHDIAPGGATGTGIILTEFVAIPLGVLLLLINIPAYIAGYRYLGGSSFLVRSLIATLAYNLGLELTRPFLPAEGVTDVMILNAVFGSLITGAAAGLIYRAGGTAGAGGVATRLFRRFLAWPVQLGKLATNSLIITAAGFVFGWEAAMYAVIAFLVSGAAADFVLEGPDTVQTALIISDRPEAISREIADQLRRGTTRWPVEGGHSASPHTALFCTVSRPELRFLKHLVADTDEDAFVIVLRGHEALGQGFRPQRRQRAMVEDLAELEDGRTPVPGYVRKKLE